MFPARHPRERTKGAPVLPCGILYFWREENYDVGCGVMSSSFSVALFIRNMLSILCVSYEL